MSETKIELDERNAIRKCAENIIATESTCIEWGASAERSVELADEAITNLVQLLFANRQIEKAGQA